VSTVRNDRGQAFLRVVDRDGVPTGPILQYLSSLRYGRWVRDGREALREGRLAYKWFPAEHPDEIASRFDELIRVAWRHLFACTHPRLADWTGRIEPAAHASGACARGSCRPGRSSPIARAGAIAARYEAGSSSPAVPSPCHSGSTNGKDGVAGSFRPGSTTNQQLRPGPAPGLLHARSLTREQDGDRFVVAASLPVHAGGEAG
jgi:hypothetical protein